MVLLSRKERIAAGVVGIHGVTLSLSISLRRLHGRERPPLFLAHVKG